MYVTAPRCSRQRSGPTSCWRSLSFAVLSGPFNPWATVKHIIQYLPQSKYPVSPQSRATIPIIDISPVLIIIVGTPVVKGFWMGIEIQSAHIRFLAIYQNAQRAQTEWCKDFANKLNATVMLVSWCTFWRSPSSSPWIQHEPKSQKTQQTVRTCQVPLSRSMPLCATLTTQSQGAKIFSIAAPRRSFASP